MERTGLRSRARATACVTSRAETAAPRPRPRARAPARRGGPSSVRDPSPVPSRRPEGRRSARGCVSGAFPARRPRRLPAAASSSRSGVGSGSGRPEEARPGEPGATSKCSTIRVSSSARRRVLPVREVERGEARDAADQLAVDPHAVEYSQRLDAPDLGTNVPYRPPCRVARPGRRSRSGASRADAPSGSPEGRRRAGVPFVVVGGAVRDASLGLPRATSTSPSPAGGRGLRRPLAASPDRARSPSEGAAADPARARPARPRRRLGDRRAAAADLLRRDFTVNALGLAFPGGRLVAPDGRPRGPRAPAACALPRDGVLVEDPLRVAARRPIPRTPAGLPARPRGRSPSCGGLPGPRPRRPERRLAELDAILAAGPRPAALALRRLEEWGALEALLPGVPPAARRRGVALVSAAAAGAGPSRLRTSSWPRPAPRPPPRRSRRSARAGGTAARPDAPLAAAPPDARRRAATPSSSSAGPRRSRSRPSPSPRRRTSRGTGPRARGGTAPLRRGASRGSSVPAGPLAAGDVARLLGVVGSRARPRARGARRGARDGGRSAAGARPGRSSSERTGAAGREAPGPFPNGISFVRGFGTWT